MKQSRFRLQTLLNVREHVEKERQRALGVAVAKTLKQQEHVRHLEAEKQRLLVNQRDASAQSMSPSQMLGYSRYLLRLKREELTGREVLKALTHEEQKRRGELLAATKEKRILEKLKEKQFKAEEKERDVLETKAADELSLTAFTRTRV